LVLPERLEFSDDDIEEEKDEVSGELVMTLKQRITEDVMRTSIHLIHLHHIKIIMPLLQPRDPMMKSELDPLHELVQS
jgi:hypothetical protein